MARASRTSGEDGDDDHDRRCFGGSPGDLLRGRPAFACPACGREGHRGAEEEREEEQRRGGERDEDAQASREECREEDEGRDRPPVCPARGVVRRDRLLGGDRRVRLDDRRGLRRPQDVPPGSSEDEPREGRDERDWAANGVAPGGYQVEDDKPRAAQGCDAEKGAVHGLSIGLPGSRL
jgi:hypothetical protein